MRSRALNDLRLARLRLRKPVRENLPAVLLELMAAALQIVEERARFPELGSGRGQQRFQFTKSMRERDLRRLEAITLVAMSIFSHMDLVRLRSGRTRSDGSCDAIRATRRRRLAGRQFAELKETTIEDETGLSRDRVVRAIADLRDAGYITCHQPRKSYEDDLTGEVRWRGYNAIYTVSKVFIERLGIDLEWLELERSKAAKRELAEPAPLIDIRVVRERRRMIRSQRQLAAKTARFMRQFEATGQERLERIRKRLEKKQE